MGIKVAIAAAVIVLVAVGVGAKVSQNKQKNDSATVSTPTPVKSTINTPSDDTLGGTFSLTNPNILFRYPNSWLLSKEKDQYVFHSSTDNSVLVTMTYQVNTDKKAVDVIASADNKGIKTEKVSLGTANLVAYKVNVSNGVKYYIGNDQVSLTFTPNTVDSKIVDQLTKSLATVKFQ